MLALSAETLHHLWDRPENIFLGVHNKAQKDKMEPTIGWAGAPGAFTYPAQHRPKGSVLREKSVGWLEHMLQMFTKSVKLTWSFHVIWVVNSSAFKAQLKKKKFITFQTGLGAEFSKLPFLNVICIDGSGFKLQWQTKMGKMVLHVAGKVPGHLQSTVKVPLSKILNPQMLGAPVWGRLLSPVSSSSVHLHACVNLCAFS